MRKFNELKRENCRFVTYVEKNSINIATTLWLDGKNYPENYKRKFAVLSNSFEKKFKQDFKNNVFFINTENWICILDTGDDNNAYETKERNRIKINYEIFVYSNSLSGNFREEKINEIIEYFINSELFKYFKEYQYIKN
jgi:hypothetical protein